VKIPVASSNWKWARKGILEPVSQSTNLPIKKASQWPLQTEKEK
jgi:hypothetical protein